MTTRCAWKTDAKPPFRRCPSRAAIRIYLRSGDRVDVCLSHRDEAYDNDLLAWEQPAFEFDS